MVRRGWISENKCKQELIKQFGKHAVIKVAIGGAEDFLVASCGELVKVVEVKEVHNKKYYARPIEKLQIERIIEFSKHHHIIAEMWIYQYSGRGKPAKQEIKQLYTPFAET